MTVSSRGAGLLSSTYHPVAVPQAPTFVGWVGQINIDADPFSSADPNGTNGMTPLAFEGMG